MAWPQSAATPLGRRRGIGPRSIPVGPYQILPEDAVDYAFAFLSGASYVEGTSTFFFGEDDQLSTAQVQNNRRGVNGTSNHGPQPPGLVPLVTVGTGGAYENPNRLGPSIAAALGGEVVLVDAGRSVAEGLRAARLHLAPGGVLVYETFLQGHERFGRPRNPDFLLRPGELRAAVVESEHKPVGWSDIMHRVTNLSAQWIVASKADDASEEEG